MRKEDWSRVGWIIASQRVEGQAIWSRPAFSVYGPSEIKERFRFAILTDNGAHVGLTDVVNYNEQIVFRLNS
ncbi:hypothetical protein ASG55_19585 [Pseudomonas sp. Leaf434]|nr:hypothetical protein ASG55_19585 [Pseudomonas sp. Leaf434]